jgi:hypothetical protein
MHSRLRTDYHFIQLWQPGLYQQLWQTVLYECGPHNRPQVSRYVPRHNLPTGTVRTISDPEHAGPRMIR